MEEFLILKPGENTESLTGKARLSRVLGESRQMHVSAVNPSSWLGQLTPRSGLVFNARGMNLGLSEPVVSHLSACTVAAG